MAKSVTRSPGALTAVHQNTSPSFPIYPGGAAHSGERIMVGEVLIDRKLDLGLAVAVRSLGRVHLDTPSTEPHLASLVIRF